MNSSITSIFFTLSMLVEVTLSVTAAPGTSIDIFKHPVTAQEDAMHPDLALAIVGGGEADVTDYPYYVSLGNCGGTLIAPDVVLTAAHCGDLTGKQVAVNLYDKTDFENVPVRYCDQWIEHSDWNLGTFDADFALCKLDRPVYMSSLTDRDIELKLNFDATLVVDDKELIVMGHGRTSSGGSTSQKLKDARVKGYPQQDCRSSKMYGSQIRDSMICAGTDDGSRDTCSGDSGGPLIKRVQIGGKIVDHLVGVASWGEACGVQMRPGVYARVSWAADFIRETTCEDFESVASWCDNGVIVQQELSKQEELCDALTRIVVNTDDFGGETSWTLKERKQGKALVTTRKYWINNRKNNHDVCLKRGMCYRLDMYDSHGDGLCGNGDCKSFALKKKGTSKFKFEISNNWGSHKRLKFCVNEKGKLVKNLKPRD